MAGPNDLEQIVQRMIGAGEPEENIALVIRQYQQAKPDLSKLPAMTPMASHGASGAAAPVAPESSSLLGRLGNAVVSANARQAQVLANPDVVKGQGDLAVGAGKGAASTVFHGGDLIRRATGMQRVIQDPDVQALITPTSTAQKIGFGGEQAGEFIVPDTGISKIISKAQAVPDAIYALRMANDAKNIVKPTVVARIAETLAEHPTAAQAVGSGATALSVGSMQTGDPGRAAIPAALAAGTPVAALGLNRLAANTLYPAVKAVLANGGPMEQFWEAVGMPEEAGAVAGRLHENLDEILRRVKETGITGGRGDWDKIAAYIEQKPDLAKQINPAGINADNQLLHEISNALSSYKPEGGFSPFGAGGVGYIVTGLKGGIPTAIAEAIRKRYPGWSAAQIDRLASILASAGAPGSLAAGSSELLTDRHVLEDELRLRAAGSQP
jgi:hypothetical protein